MKLNFCIKVRANVKRTSSNTKKWIRIKNPNLDSWAEIDWIWIYPKILRNLKLILLILNLKFTRINFLKRQYNLSRYFRIKINKWEKLLINLIKNYNRKIEILNNFKMKCNKLLY